jgi:hypothetical protein
MRSGLSNTVARVVTRLSASKSFWFFAGLFSVAMLGCVMMWGQPWQPDVWMLFAGIFAVYALWRFWIAWRKGMPAHTLFAGVAPRFLLTLVVAGLVGATGIRQAFTETLAGRDKQIAEASRAGGQKHLSAEQEAQKAFDRWIFATGWSLLPEACAEFLVPGIFGNDSLRAPYPYWGRLGQPYAFQPGKMMPNYRQHTIYLGLVSLVLACFGVFAWLTFRRTKVFSPRQPAAGCRLPTATSSPDLYMDYLRAPVKFLHFTEVATALLAEFGLEALLAIRTPARLRRGFLLGAGTVRRAAPGRGNALVLAERRQAALPSIHFAWAGGVAPERQADQACQKDQTLVSTDAPPPAAPSARPPQPMAFMQTRGERGVFVTKGETDAPEPGLLVWNERYSPALVARIDGNVVPVHQADGLWCAIPVPSGRHQITIRMRYQPLWNLIAAGTNLLVVLAGLAGARAKAHRNGMR